MSDHKSQRWRRVDKPEPGCFLVRQIKGGPRVPARICFDGRVWWAEVSGVRMSDPQEEPFAAAWVDRIWHGGTEITQMEHDRLLGRIAKDPHHPARTPGKKLDVATLPPLF